jgi:ThiF family
MTMTTNTTAARQVGRARLHYPGAYDDERYWARVARNLGYLGSTESEARSRQERLRDTVVGVAGCGGIGGAMVEKLARMGVLRINCADLDTFEHSNINRQLGAGFATVGRNKAEVVASLVHEMAPDVEIEAYLDGITADNADEFVQGCDYVLDEIEPYAYPARYALHRAFRRSDRCRFMLTGQVYGNRTFIWKWTRDSMPIEDLLGVPEGVAMSAEVAERLMGGLIPEWPGYPTLEMQRRWLVEGTTCPIVPGAPPMSQGLLTERLMLAITGIEEEEGSARLPVSPGYAMVDSRTWEARMVERPWS